MFDNFKKTFKKVVKQEPEEELESKSAAKERLQLVLMQDRANVSSEFLELMKNEIIDVVKKYVIIDEDTIDVRLTTKVNEDGTNGEPTLYANIPILNIRNELKADKMFNQLDFSDLIEEQAEAESKKIETQEKQQLFNMSDTNRTVILDDDTLSKINKELVTTKEKEAKQEVKQAKQEARHAIKERLTGSIPIVKVKADKEAEKNEYKEEASKTLRKSIEEEIAELDDLEKELFSVVNSEEAEYPDENDDFVTFDELYEKATREDNKTAEKEEKTEEAKEQPKIKKNKSNDKKGK